MVIKVDEIKKKSSYEPRKKRKYVKSAKMVKDVVVYDDENVMSKVLVGMYYMGVPINNRTMMKFDLPYRVIFYDSEKSRTRGYGKKLKESTRDLFKGERAYKNFTVLEGDLGETKIVTKGGRELRDDGLYFIVFSRLMKANKDCIALTDYNRLVGCDLMERNEGICSYLRFMSGRNSKGELKQNLKPTDIPFIMSTMKPEVAFGKSNTIQLQYNKVNQQLINIKKDNELDK